MKKDKILIRINNLEEVVEYKKVEITNFLFPLEDFSVGYNTFKIEDLNMIDANIYLLVNRVFDKDALDNFLNIKDKLNFVKGIFYEDIAVYQILKDTNIKLFWNQMHAVISANAVNFWLDFVHSAVLSNELTKEEINEILNSAKKSLVLPVFGQNIAMYSRRSLITNYNNYIGYPNIKSAVLKTANVEFKAVETKYGTVFLNNKYFNLIKFIDSFDYDKILYYFIDPGNIPPKEMLEIIDGKDILDDNRFFDRKTIYKIGDIND